ncbi:TonB family protein [Pseudoduganella sp. DS3]|uniref:TonB family protein n=1 Tax=Pseudoduganella guangdongensis TaxID=2692179 RepID=A0A6N9HGR0_9BURK|nr:energy transducer TonB [Pseudoduganella guangdongensis]MYN02549.1 TonB family protein [Pseudoduganella guangdongensis]
MNFPGRRHPAAAALCVLLHAALLLAFLQQKPRGHAAQQEVTAIMLVLPAVARQAHARPPKPEARRAKALPAPAANPAPLLARTAVAATAAPAAQAAPDLPPATAADAGAQAPAAPQLPLQAAVAAAPVAKPEPAPVQMARPDHAHSPQPEYPMALRELGVQGTVLLRVWVEPDGRPGDIRLARSSGQRLFDDAALRAVRSWRFLPARAGEQAIASWVEFPIRFNLI